MESDPPVSEASATWKNDIVLSEKVEEDSTMGIMSSSS